MGALHFTTDSTMAASQMLSFGIGMYSSLILVLSLISLAAASEECVDLLSVDECQIEVVETGLCSVVQFQTDCRRTCGFCEADDSSMMSTVRPAEMSEECEDVLPVSECEAALPRGECNQEPYHTDCRRTCGLCVADCTVDVYPPSLCEWVVYLNECDLEQWGIYCRRSCGICEDDDSSMMSTARPAEMSQVDSSMLLMSRARSAEMSEGCSMDCFEAHPNKHVSYGTPSGGVMSLCECRDICDNDDACIGFDFNNDAAPYQDHSCWLHYVEGDLIWPAMDVDHYVNVC